MNNITLSGIAEFIKKNDNYIILCHTNPDEDTVCSAYALYLTMEKIGKSAQIVCDKDIPERIKDFVDEKAFSKDIDSEGHCVISVDIAARQMLGGLRNTFENSISLRIDHHKVSENFATYNYNDSSASAAAIIIYKIICKFCKPDAEIANSLFIAISSDTGGFRYSNTNAQAHRVAAALISCGANSAAISEMLYESKTKSNMLAMKLAIEKTQFLCADNVAFIFITNADKKREGLCDTDFDEISSLSRTIRSIKLGIVMKQSDDDETKFKISMRSRENIDCSEICSRLGGGGHQRASGALITAYSPEIAEEILISEVMAHMEQWIR